MSNSPTQKSEWAALEKLSNDLKDVHLNDLFKEDTTRFNDLSLTVDNLFFDYSKQRVTTKTITALIALLEKSDFNKKRAEMFDGKIINHTEKRAVLHTALRRSKDDNVRVNNENVIPQIHSTLDKIEKFSNNVRNGKHLGSTGKPITKIISIGIGGSDLGPRLISDALSINANQNDQIIDTSYVSNIDGHDLKTALRNTDPEQTLFVIISKSFTTQETLTNGLSARQWMIDHLPDGADISKHFIAVSSNIAIVEEFGISKDNIFPMWEWVNGRFSLWSAVGLPICLQHGFQKFRELLDGARQMDEHFLNAPLNKNIPVLMALIGVWNRNFLNLPHLAILPYAQSLKYFPAYLQQLEMESNGKTIDNDGQPITNYETAPVLFGEIGTNGQHSFYQLLHQGSGDIACDFIGFVQDKNNIAHHHDLLLNNMLAQGQAMMQGQHNPPYNDGETYRYFKGNKPSSTLLIKESNAFSLGQLIAIYEHKTFTQGVVWNINSFDQFGVELGKDLSRKLEKQDLSSADPSTKGLYSFIHKSNK